MQPIIAALVLVGILVPPCFALAQQAEVPHFDLARTCRDARAYTGNDKEVAFQGCMKDENDAREQLVQKWAHFKPTDRSDCIAQGAAPIPSYVMNEEAAALNKPDRARAGKSQGNSLQGKPGQDQAAPSSSGPAPLVPLPDAGGATTGPN